MSIILQKIAMVSHYKSMCYDFVSKYNITFARVEFTYYKSYKTTIKFCFISLHTLTCKIVLFFLL